MKIDLGISLVFKFRTVTYSYSCWLVYHTKHSGWHSCQTQRSISSSSPLYATSVDGLPGYNHGLTGKGKSSRSVKLPEYQVVPDVNGEVLFGLHPVYLALKSNRRKTFHSLFVSDKYCQDAKVMSPLVRQICLLASTTGTPTKFVGKEVLDFLAGHRPHQGVCLDTDVLVCPLLDHTVEPEWHSKNPPLWLLLYNIQDPMNFGAILRSSYMMGVERVVIPTKNSCRLSPVVSKSSSGAMEVADISRLSQTTTEVEFCQSLRQHGWDILGTVGSRFTTVFDDNDDKCIPLQEFTMSKPSLLALGNEGSGLSQEMTKLCRVQIQIQSYQTDYRKEIDSLNVSVAAGIIFHWLQMSKLKATLK